MKRTKLARQQWTVHRPINAINKFLRHQIYGSPAVALLWFYGAFNEPWNGSLIGVHCRRRGCDFSGHLICYKDIQIRANVKRFRKRMSGGWLRRMQFWVLMLSKAPQSDKNKQKNNFSTSSANAGIFVVDELSWELSWLSDEIALDERLRSVL